MRIGTPMPSIELVKEICANEYHISGRVSELGGENNNYLIETEDGPSYVLKFAAEDLSRDEVELENSAIEHVHAAGIGVDLPRIIKTRGGSIEASFEVQAGLTLRARLHNFLVGTPWYEAGEPTQQQISHLGRILGEIDLALSELSHPAAFRTHHWDLNAASQHRNKVALVDDETRRRIGEWMFHFFAASALPNLSALPHSLIHGDVNDENLLIQDGQISGLLDFSDYIYNPTICDLAIAIAYAMLEQEHPLEVGREIVRSYHEVRPLSIEELTVLYPLICGRLCITVAIAAERRRRDPNHPNWFVTEERAWRLLERLFECDPAEATNHLILGTGIVPHNGYGDSLEKLLEKRSHFISRSLSIAYREPLKIVRGEGQYLFDNLGRPYLDLVNNVCHVGHCNPRVVEAGYRQMKRLNTNTRYLYDGLTEYSERLCATLPEPLNICFFVNSGSEANELALRLAMNHTKRKDLLVIESAYHGNTGGLINISPYKFMGRGGVGYSNPWVHVVPMPDGYRGPYKGNDRDAGIAYGDEVGCVIADASAPIAAFITESLLGCAGQIIPPEGYLETAFQHVRNAGGVCIVDEVQVGFGRVGTHFWGFEMQEVVPDIVVMGKPIGNGHPMAAVVTTKEIADSFENGMEFFSTFGGNPVSCAVGLAVLDVIRDEALQDHALEIGTRLLEGLRGLMPNQSLIGDVRGAGLFIGVELVQDRTTLEPAMEEANELVNRMKGRGMLLSTDGPLHNVIKIKPPMVLTADDVDMVVRCFAEELSVIGMP